MARHCPQGLFSPLSTFLLAIFFRPFRLSLAPTICPWVFEDEQKTNSAKSRLYERIKAKKTFKKFAKTGEQNIARISNFINSRLRKREEKAKTRNPQTKKPHTVEPPVSDHPKCKD